MSSEHRVASSEHAGLNALAAHTTAELEYELVWRKVQRCTLQIVDAQRALDNMRSKQEARLRELARIGGRGLSIGEASSLSAATKLDRGGAS